MSLSLVAFLACSSSRPSPGETASADSADTSAEAGTPTFSLGSPELVFTGGYADPSPVSFGDTVWLYLNRSVGPEDGTLAYTADDALDWRSASGLIFPGVATARAVLVPEGVRVYYPAPEPAADGTRGDPEAPRQIYSALSTDGVRFSDDADVGLSAEGGDPGGPAVFQVGERWRMLHDVHSTAEDGLVSGEIWGAWSDDGLAWTPDAAPTIIAEGAVEDTEPVSQVLHPFVLPGPDGGWLMFYNSHVSIFAARSADGEIWEKLGPIGVEGADFAALALEDGSTRAWYGTWSEATQGEVWTMTLEISSQ